MKGQSGIEDLAMLKLKEAECLLENKFFDGAYYLAGYVVEVLLKAKICKTLDVPDFFLFDRTKKQKVYKPYKSHDYEQLLMLSGLYSKFKSEPEDHKLKYYWFMMSNWNEGCRYLIGKTQTEVENFINSVKEVSLWIQKHL